MINSSKKHGHNNHPDKGYASKTNTIHYFIFSILSIIILSLLLNKCDGKFLPTISNQQTDTLYLTESIFITDTLYIRDTIIKEINCDDLVINTGSVIVNADTVTLNTPSLGNSTYSDSLLNSLSKCDSLLEYETSEKNKCNESLIALSKEYYKNLHDLNKTKSDNNLLQSSLSDLKAICDPLLNNQQDSCTHEDFYSEHHHENIIPIDKISFGMSLGSTPTIKGSDFEWGTYIGFSLDHQLSNIVNNSIFFETGDVSYYDVKQKLFDYSFIGYKLKVGDPEVGTMNLSIKADNNSEIFSSLGVTKALKLDDLIINTSLETGVTSKENLFGGYKVEIPVIGFKKKNKYTAKTFVNFKQTFFKDTKLSKTNSIVQMGLSVKF